MEMSQKMPVDNTALFRARTKLIGQRKAKEEKEETTLQTQAVQRGTSSPGFRPLVSEAKTLAEELAELKLLVADRRIDYLTFQGPLGMGMSETERDTFDKDVGKALTQFHSLVVALRNRMAAVPGLRAKDEVPHLEAVTRSLDRRLKSVADTVTELRRLRLENAKHRKRYSRLSSLVEQYKDRIGSILREEGGWTIEEKAEEAIEKPKRNSDGWEEIEDVQEEEEENKASTPHFASAFSALTKEEPLLRKRKLEPKEAKDWPTAAAWSQDQEKREKEADLELNPVERMQLQAENERLFERLSHVNHEVQNIETQFAEIQRLQTTFAEKVEQQERIVDNIYTTAEATTTNLRDGNEWIRQAITNQAGRRVVVLFCIIVFTFTLLFLDWYNP